MRLSLLVISSFLRFSLLITAQNSSCTTNQPPVSAPHNNPWKALSVDESAAVNDILQQRFNLTGNQGSRQVFLRTLMVQIVSNKGGI
jgi:primary-amine oxidase